MKLTTNSVIWIFSVAIVALIPCLNKAADPVYSPQNLSDTSGNVAYSNATIAWADLPTGENYQGVAVSRISEGLEYFYHMVHGFIAAVLPQAIPDDIIEKIIDGKVGEIASNYSDYTTFFIGYAICVAVGVLFMLVVPIIACCFCCCRCCCKKCGGKLVQPVEESENTCKKWTFIFILLVVLVFLVVGSVCILLNNDATTTAITDIPRNMVTNIKDLRVYVNNTVLEATHLIQTNYNFLNISLIRDLDNVAYLVGLPLRTDIETNTGIRSTLTNAYNLVTGLDNADTALSDIESKVSDLSSSVTTMESSLNTVKTSLDSIFTSCGVNCPPVGRPDYATAITTGVDSSNFPDLTAPRSSMNSAKSVNMTAQIVDAEAEVDGIPNTVVTDSATIINDMKQKISDLSDDIDPIMNQIRDIQKLFVGSNATFDLDKLTDDVNDFGETLEKYDKYRWYGGLSLGCIVLLFVIIMAGGLTLGILGTTSTTHPANRGCMSNAGGVLLMISVYLIFLFAIFLMLLTTATFIIGAPVHRLACFPITDLDELEDIAQIYNDHEVGAGKYFLGDLVLNNDSLPLTLSGMLRDCMDSKSAFTAFKMAEKFDLSDLLNYTKTVNVQAEIDSINVDLSSTNVYPTALETQLTDLKSAVNINFASFYTELQNTPTTGNLSTLADDIDTYAAIVTDPTSKANLEAEATNLRNIEANEYADVQSKINALNASVSSMEASVNSIPSQVDTLDTGLNETNVYIQNSTGIVIQSLLNSYASRLLGIADSFSAHTDYEIKNRMGNCQPVWNTYNTLLVYTFCYNFMDTFNGFWFSLGWCVFFATLGLIFSVKLAKYFRRMRDMEWPRRQSKIFENKVYPKMGLTEMKGEGWPQSTQSYARFEIWPRPEIGEEITEMENSELETQSVSEFCGNSDQKSIHSFELNSTKYTAKLSHSSNDHLIETLIPIDYDETGLSASQSSVNEPGKSLNCFELNNTKFIAKKSPANLSLFDEPLVPVAYDSLYCSESPNSVNECSNSVDTESAKAKNSPTLRRACLRIDYSENTIEKPQGSVTENSRITNTNDSSLNEGADTSISNCNNMKSSPYVISVAPIEAYQEDNLDNADESETDKSLFLTGVTPLHLEAVDNNDARTVDKTDQQDFTNSYLYSVRPSNDTIEKQVELHEVDDKAIMKQRSDLLLVNGHIQDNQNKERIVAGETINNDDDDSKAVDAFVSSVLEKVTKESLTRF